MDQHVTGLVFAQIGHMVASRRHPAEPSLRQRRHVLPQGEESADGMQETSVPTFGMLPGNRCPGLAPPDSCHADLVPREHRRDTRHRREQTEPGDRPVPIPGGRAPP